MLCRYGVHRCSIVYYFLALIYLAFFGRAALEESWAWVGLIMQSKSTILLLVHLIGLLLPISQLRFGLAYRICVDFSIDCSSIRMNQKLCLVVIRTELHYHLAIVSADIAFVFQSENTLNTLWIKAHYTIELVPYLEDQPLKSPHLSFHSTIDLQNVEFFASYNHCRFGKERFVDCLLDLLLSTTLGGTWDENTLFRFLLNKLVFCMVQHY